MTNLVKWIGADFSAEHVLTVGDKGVGDTAITTVSSNAAATIVLDDTVSPAVSFTSDGTNASYIQWSGSWPDACRVSLKFKTPSSWSASAMPVWVGKNSSSRACGFYLGGSGSPGQVRLTNAAGTYLANSTTNLLALDTWYRAEFWFDLSDGSYGIEVFSNSGENLYTNSGTSNFGSTITAFSLGCVFPVPATAFRAGYMLVTDDVETPIGEVGTATHAKGVYIWDGTTEIPLTTPDATPRVDYRIYDSGWPARPDCGMCISTGGSSAPEDAVLGDLWVKDA